MKRVSLFLAALLLAATTVFAVPQEAENPCAKKGQNPCAGKKATKKVKKEKAKAKTGKSEKEKSTKNPCNPCGKKPKD